MSNRFPLSLKQLRAFLRSPWALLFALTLGIILGIQSPEVDAVLKPVGQLYLSLLKMCVLPILISGIILNIASLVAQPHFSNYLLRFCQVFLATMFLVSTSGFLITSALGPGRFLDPTTLSNLGILILDESGLDLEIPLELAIASIPEPDPLGTFLLDIVPENIFNALSNGNVLQVLFAAILFGLSLGTSYRQQKVSDPVFEVFDNIYQSFSKLIDWLILFLPLGLLSLIASQVAITGLDAIRIMGKFVLCSVVMFTLFYVSSLFVIAQTTQLSFSKTFKALQRSNLVALATSNALTAIPLATKVLTSTFRCDRQTSNTVLPVAIMVGRFGQIGYFTMASVFVVQLYDKPLSIQGIVTVLLGSTLAGIASTGSTSIATLSALTFVLTPLNLPLESVSILLIAVDPLLNPLRTLCTLNLSVASTTFVAQEVSRSAILTES